ncbi:hypothetical protein AMK26_22135 [Streptomyces sp. CB03234]|uniref:hypothetical protein n=1 Tax=Streptomyces sp. (strain CB03234) TaxID=1703937 RepID=UPI00093BCEB2|nr:hypothetical protein [Streptomyces sp. CB03234]OKK02373.1 hypothetical protein AMK26_22135 [Streptomyces sp. CB03234]
MANRNDDLADLTRQAVDTAGALRMLVERMNDLGLRMSDHSDADLLAVASDYSDEDLRTVASALRGTAMIMLMDRANAELLSEWLRKLRSEAT